MTRRIGSAVLGAALVLISAGRLSAQSDDAHKRVYQKTVDSVVAVRAVAPLGERSGSGVILSKEGFVLTSYATCPVGATNIRVFVKGPRLYANAEVVATSQKHELTLLRIKPRGELKPIELGESSKVKTGEVSYTIGNAANSIILDDQPSFNVGVVSGVYRLADERANSTYTGPVYETTAAVNVGMEGAPCLNADGRMVGFVTLNYSPHRFLGTAIPIDELRATIERLMKAPTDTVEASAPAGEGWIGLKVKTEGGKVVVDSVEKDGPAELAGFGKGDVILEIGNTPVKSVKDLDDKLKGMEAGSIIWVKADVAGKVETLKVTLEKKK